MNNGDFRQTPYLIGVCRIASKQLWSQSRFKRCRFALPIRKLSMRVLLTLKEMCYAPITIRNKAFHTLGGFEFLRVPCGHCDDCAVTKQIDYFVRTYCMARALPDSWSLWFCTFTFNDDYLPRSKYVWSTHSDLTGLHYHLSDKDFPCFNHDLLKRFLKSLSQYYRRKGLESPQYLVTCEFGSKRGRPHYHAILAVPELYGSWRDFANIVNNYWHYGFTYNCRLSHLNGITKERSVSTAIKYVTKYVTKSSYASPFYLNSERVWLHSYTPAQYKPRVFTSNGFGESLENQLTDTNYKLGKVTLCIDGQYKSYSVPAYYMRKHFVGSHVLNSEKLLVKDYWHPDGVVKYRKQQSTFYKFGYADLKRKNTEKRLSSLYRAAVREVPTELTVEELVKLKMLDYDRGLKSRYKLRTRYLSEYDPINELNYDQIYHDAPIPNCACIVQDKSYDSYTSEKSLANFIARQVEIQRLQARCKHYVEQQLTDIEYVVELNYKCNNFRKCRVAMSRRDSEMCFYNNNVTTQIE